MPPGRSVQQGDSAGQLLLSLQGWAHVFSVPSSTQTSPDAQHMPSHCCATGHEPPSPPLDVPPLLLPLPLPLPLPLEPPLPLPLEAPLPLELPLPLPEEAPLLLAPPESSVAPLQAPEMS